MEETGNDTSDYTEIRENQYLHYVLATLRSPDPDETQNAGASSSPSQSTEQLQRTYKKALSDYRLACEQLEAQTALKGKAVAALRSALREKEDKIERSASTLQDYRESVAVRSSFANNKSFGTEDFEELKSQDLGEQLEAERRKHVANRVNLERLEQKLRKKSDLAGGVSDIEYQRLAEDIRKADEKSACHRAALNKMTEDEERQRRRRELLSVAISDLEAEHQEKERELKDLDADIEEKTAYMARMKRKAQVLKKEIGYDASDIGALLQSDSTNEDFEASKCELERLTAKFQLLSDALKLSSW